MIAILVNSHAWLEIQRAIEEITCQGLRNSLVKEGWTAIDRSMS